MGADNGIDRREFLAGAGLAAAGLAGGEKVLLGAARAAGRTGKPIRSAPRTLQQAIRGHVFYPGQPGYSTVVHVYNERFDGIRPRALARPLNTADVRAAVQWAVSRGVQVRAKSGGHSYAGYSTLRDGIVLDMWRIRNVTVNRRARTATIGAGAQLIDVYTQLARAGATIPGGSCPSVGIAGVTLGGGMGLAGRAFGLTADNLVGARIVTADGRIRQVDSRHEPDLLWALRGGGGGNFGIVTQFTFRIHPLPRSAAYFFVNWPWSEAEDAIAAWQAWAPHARDQLTSIFHLNAGAGSNSVSVSGQYLGGSGALGSLLAPLMQVPGASVSVGDMGYAALQMLWAGCAHTSLTACHTAGTRPGGTLERASFNAKSDYVSRPLPVSARRLLVEALETRAGQPGSGAILFDAYGGAINRVWPTASAFVHRNELFCIQYLSYNGGAGWLGQTHGAMRPYVSGQAYQNYIDGALGGWQQAYYGRNYARLKAIRREVDPHHYFNFPQAIGR